MAAKLRCHVLFDSGDALGKVLSFVCPRDGSRDLVSSVGKGFRDAWRLRVRGTYRAIGRCYVTSDVTVMPFKVWPGPRGGVIVPVNAGERPGLYFFDRRAGPPRWGSAIYCELLEDVQAFCSVNDTRAWVCSSYRSRHDVNEIALVRYDGDGHVSYDKATRALGPVMTWENCYEIQDIALSPLGTALEAPSSNSAGPTILVLTLNVNTCIGQVEVFDPEGGLCYIHAGPGVGLCEPQGFCVFGNLCFVAATYNHCVVIFQWTTGVHVSTVGQLGPSFFSPKIDVDAFGRWDVPGNSEPCFFDEPYAVAARGDTLVVAERRGDRVQLFRFPHGFWGERELLQVIRPEVVLGHPRAFGVCFDDDGYLWCLAGWGVLGVFARVE